MKILYGIENNNMDVTLIAYNKCLINDIICIPFEDHSRSLIFGDPLIGTKKSIFIVKDGTMKEYNDDIYLQINTVNYKVILKKKNDFLHPITFSIPSEKISKRISEKSKILSSLIPGDISTYIYNNEEEYYNEYKRSLFAKTTKKGGWDCLRHYEILANGCIPYFPDIENCPPNTMKLLPKDIILYGNSLYEKYKDKHFNDLDEIELNECYLLISELIEYTETHLTTIKMAEYMLNTVNRYNVSKILYLSGNTDPDYLRCLTLHGLKKIFGKKCHDYPKIPHLYKDNKIDFSQLYGKGITYTNLLENENHDETLDYSIESDIINHEYDIVIYGSYHRGTPYYDLVTKYYNNDDVILMYGEDIDLHTYIDYISLGHHVFVREL